MSKNNAIVPIELIENKIYLIRGLKVMLDRDLAVLYGVENRSLNQAVKRNIERFPSDFMFELTNAEVLRCQFGTSKYEKRGGTQYLPYAFTEQGVAMLSSVLKSQRAIAVNIQIIRTFTKLREMIRKNDDLGRKLEAMEKRYDEQFKIVFDAIRKLLKEPEQKQNEIGFKLKVF